MSKKPKYHEGFRTLIAGISGMGKSYFVKQRFLPMLKEHKPVIVFDRKEEYAGKFAKDHNPGWRGYPGVNAFFKDVMKRDNGYLKVGQVYVINCQSDVDYVSGLQFFLKLKAPVSLVLDEAHDIFLDKDFYQAKNSLVKMVRYGRSFGTDVVMITQRTKDIPPDIRSQFLGAISFKQSHKDDVKALDERGWKEAEAVLDLNKTEYKIFGDFPEHLNLKKPQLS